MESDGASQWTSGEMMTASRLFIIVEAGEKLCK